MLKIKSLTSKFIFMGSIMPAFIAAYITEAGDVVSHEKALVELKGAPQWF